MTGAHIVTWKLNRARLSFLAGSKDMSNAFCCGSHRPMNDRILARHEPGTALILNARRLTSCVQITAPDGYVVARIGSGAMQGDGNAPDVFLDSFRDVIEGWRDDTLSQRTMFQKFVPSTTPSTMAPFSSLSMTFYNLWWLPKTQCEQGNCSLKAAMHSTRNSHRPASNKTIAKRR